MENGKNTLTATVTMDAMEYVDMINYIRNLKDKVRQQIAMIEELRSATQKPGEIVKCKSEDPAAVETPAPNED